MSRTLKVTGNNVMYAHGAWFLRITMATSRALCCLPLVKKQKHDFNFSVQCIIKQLLDSVFVISRIIEVSVRVISLSLRLQLITPTLSSIILDITKTSSNNNCLQSYLYWLTPLMGRHLVMVPAIYKHCIFNLPYADASLKFTFFVPKFVCLWEVQHGCQWY